MLLGSREAVNGVVALALLVLAAVLVSAGRRRPDSLLLAFFLGLVGINFFGIALHSRGGAHLAAAALALDPFYLLLFVTLYPSARRPRWVKALLVADGVAAVAMLAFVLFFPTGTVIEMGTEPMDPRHLMLVAYVALTYLVAWFLALRAAVDAPTPSLARRAAWLVAALGVMVIPRVALVPADLGRAGGADGLLVEVAIMGAVFGASLAMARRDGRTPGDLRTALRFTGFTLLGLLLLRVMVDLLLFGSMPEFGWGGSFGFRWIVFAGVLAYGILAYEVLDLDRVGRRIFPMVGAFLAAVLVGVLALFLLPADALTPAAGIALSVTLGLAVTGPAGYLTRVAVRAAEARRGADEHAERRLELYRAALEAAWANGPPPAHVRERLERDRRAFGLSGDEARALEHVVSSSIRRRVARLQPGDEPAPGLVVEAFIGEGAHGRVFAARRHPPGDKVVVKELHADALGAEETRQQLLREFRALQGIDHPNVARLLDVRVVQGRYLLVMERVEGPSLAACLASGPMSEQDARRVGEALLGALEAAHAKGVIHRDVKPANVLLDESGVAHLADWGVAIAPGGDVARGGTVSGLAAMREVTGTLGYMAPEQARGVRTDARADLYGVGLVLYEMLTGRAALDLRGCGYYQALERAASPDVSWEGVPPAWEAFLRKALAPDPDARFPSARAMRDALPAAAVKAR